MGCCSSLTEDDHVHFERMLASQSHPTEPCAEESCFNPLAVIADLEKSTTGSDSFAWQGKSMYFALHTGALGVLGSCYMSICVLCMTCTRSRLSVDCTVTQLVRLMFVTTAHTWELFAT